MKENMAVKMDNDRTHSVYIVLDEKRIIEDNQGIASMKKYIDNLCERNGMHPDGDGWYVNGTFETAGAIITVLSMQKWFMEYIKEWYWYDHYDKSCEDLVSSRKEGVTRYVSFAPKHGT